VPLSQYYRQYLGVTGGRGNRIIHVIGFVEPSSDIDWRHEAYLVEDGGTAVFEVDYSVKDRKFGPLRFHGAA
jgi:hypothetical protein